VEVRGTPAADEAGLERAIRRVAAMRAEMGPTTDVSFDVSPTCLERPGVADEIARLLHAAAVPSPALMLEVREIPRIRDLDVVVDEMEHLCAIGVRLAVDNLGQGFASLEYLRRLPVDVVKIAPSLIAGVSEDAQVAGLVSAVLDLASTTGLEAIATGIESSAQAEALREMGCVLGQGQLFSGSWTPRSTAAPPVSIEPVTGWRVWSLLEVDGEVRLRSITRPDVWPVGDAFHASCPTSNHGGGAPNGSCSCGIYAAGSIEDLARSGVLSMSASVVGTIAMWGTVVEHASGARSEFAYPSRLRLVCGTCLGEGRGVVEPSFIIGWGGVRLSARCSRHAKGEMGDTRPAAEVQAVLLSSYSVDLLPLEPASTQLRFTPVSSPRRHALEPLARGILMVLGAVINVIMAIWALSGLVFFAYWVVASVVELFR